MIKFESTPPPAGHIPGQEGHPSIKKHRLDVPQELSQEKNRINFDQEPQQDQFDTAETPVNSFEAEGDSTIENRIAGIEDQQNSTETAEASNEMTGELVEGQSQESMEGLVENTPEGKIEKPLVSVDHLHTQLQELYKAEKLENPNEIIDPKEQLRSLDESFSKINERLAELNADLKSKKTAMDKVRSFLGMENSAELTREEQEMQSLEAVKAELIGYKEEAESMDALQKVMDEFQGLSPEDLTIVINMGTMPNGEPVMTEDGKEVDAEVAKEIANAVQDGVKFLTCLVVKTVLGIVKGVIGGVFAAVKQMKEGLI